MASSMMHYIISNQILKNYPDVDNNKFLFGATLGPDASSHDDGTYDIAHFGSVDKDKKGIDWQKFEQKHGDKMLEDGFYLGYWCHLIQDAVWFHDVVDKYIRVFEGEKKKECYQKGYRDYGRLNYLLQKRNPVKVPDFDLALPMLEGISEDKMIMLRENFYLQFDALPCEADSLELYKWDVIMEYMEHCVNLCVSEIKAFQSGTARWSPKELFVRK